MKSLIAKIMSNENLPDSDSRKSYKLIPVPDNHEIEFRRLNLSIPEMIFHALFGDSDPITVPLQDSGNVYILENGKTISTFGSAPPPHTEQAIAEQPKDTPFNQSYFDQLMQLFDRVTDQAQPEEYPWFQVVAAALAGAPASLPPEGLCVPFAMADGRLTDRARAFVKTLNSALLNSKPMLALEGAKLIKANYVYLVQIIPAPYVEKSAYETQTAKEELLNRDISHSVVNAVQRALKMYNHGATFAVLTPALRISPKERVAITAIFKKWHDVDVKFRFVDDLCTLFYFD